MKKPYVKSSKPFKHPRWTYITKDMNVPYDGSFKKQELPEAWVKSRKKSNPGNYENKSRQPNSRKSRALARKATKHG